MKGITIKLPEELYRRLSAEARETGRSIAAVVREKLLVQTSASGRSVYAKAGDLAGVLAGSRRPATNQRRKFRRA